VFKTDIDARKMIAVLSELEKSQFPFALARALNDTAFEDIRPGWKDEMLRVFDRPTRITLNAVLVKKATKKLPIAEIYLRDQATKGTPPVRFLAHQVEGGTRRKKPFENLLRQIGVMEANEFAVPGKSYPLDAFGNVPGRVINAVLSDVGGSRDRAAVSTPASRRKRERRRTKRGGVYFYSRGDGRVPRGIYERIRTGFGTGVRTVFVFVTGARYRQRLDVDELTSDLFRVNFPKRFRKAMRHAVATARKKRR
jgi:hypothetical protein